jgi:hypothetical protein
LAHAHPSLLFSLLQTFLCCLQDKLVEKQLGPAPPARASPGMVLQYSTMMAERRASLLVDNISSLVEGLAGVVVKVCPL